MLFIWARSTSSQADTIFLKPGEWYRSQFSLAAEATRRSVDRFPFPVPDPKRLCHERESVSRVRSCRRFSRGIASAHVYSMDRLVKFKSYFTLPFSLSLSLSLFSLSILLGENSAVYVREKGNVACRLYCRPVWEILSFDLRVLRTPCRFHSGKKLTTTARRFSMTCLRRLSVAREPERDGSERAAGSGRTAISPDIEARA